MLLPKLSSLLQCFIALSMTFTNKSQALWTVDIHANLRSRELRSLFFFKCAWEQDRLYCLSPSWWLSGCMSCSIYLHPQNRSDLHARVVGWLRDRRARVAKLFLCRVRKSCSKSWFTMVRNEAHLYNYWLSITQLCCMWADSWQVD